MSWHALIIFRIYVIETKLDIVSVDDKNLKRRRKVVGQRDFPTQNSYTGQVQCLSHSRDPKFVTSLVQSAIIRCKERHAIAHAAVSATNENLLWQEFIMASFPSIQITEGEWTPPKYWDILGVKVVSFFTDNPALLADYISNFETRPDDVFVVSYAKSGSCFL